MEPKTTTRKTTEKKGVAVNASLNEVDAVSKVFFQYAGQEIVANDVLQKVKMEYLANGKAESDIQSIQLYIKPEENAAYYIINGEADGRCVSLH